MRKVFTLIFVTAILVSCDYSERDIANPRLPRYTDQGANTAGCIINEKVWFDPCYYGFFGTSTSCDGLTVAVDTVLNYSELSLSGGYYTPDFEDLESLNIVFRLPSVQIGNISSLRGLLGSELPIDGCSVVADIMRNGESILACGNLETTLTGKIFFRSGGSDHNAFAGTFGFSANSNCGKQDALYGRFDYNIATVSFISLN